MNALEKYRCEGCGEIHDNYKDARDCCEPDITEVWVCERCESEYRDEDEAEACCPSGTPETADEYRARIQELEEAGQRRLLP